jgi:hypothetical protein
MKLGDHIGRNGSATASTANRRMEQYFWFVEESYEAALYATSPIHVLSNPSSAQASLKNFKAN